MHLFSKRKQSMPTRACIFYKPFTIAFAVCAFATGTISAELADAIDRPHTRRTAGRAHYTGSLLLRAGQQP